MSIINAINQTFAAVDATFGVANSLQTLGADFTYTVGSVATSAIKIIGYNATTNLVTFAYTSAPLVYYTGTLIGNTANSFLISLSGVVAGVSGVNLYISTTALGLGAVVNVPVESPTSPVYVACYCRGTMIRTPDGQRAVEDLKRGDLVDCLHGGVAPVRWVGKRAYRGRFLRANPQLRPVRFKAGSLDTSLPERDLLVSPQHSMLIDGVLVPAQMLVNGRTIMVETGLTEVEYFHVELDRHDAVWAENALSETFVDDDSRAMFHNAAEWAELYPDQERVRAVFCAPRVEGGPELSAIRRRLNGMVGQVAEAA